MSEKIYRMSVDPTPLIVDQNYLAVDATIAANETLAEGTILTMGEDGKCKAVTKKADPVFGIALAPWHETYDGHCPVLIMGKVRKYKLSTGTPSDGGKVEDYYLSALSNKIVFA